MMAAEQPEVDPVEATHLADRIRAADRRAVAPVPEYFTLTRTEVHILALQLDHDRALIAALRTELERCTRGVLINPEDLGHVEQLVREYVALGSSMGYPVSNVMPDDRLTAMQGALRRFAATAATR